MRRQPALEHALGVGRVQPDGQPAPTTAPSTRVTEPKACTASARTIMVRRQAMMVTPYIMGLPRISSGRLPRALIHRYPNRGPYHRQPSALLKTTPTITAIQIDPRQREHDSLPFRARSWQLDRPRNQPEMQGRDAR